jgi:hypothetical protein
MGTTTGRYSKVDRIISKTLARVKKMKLSEKAQKYAQLIYRIAFHRIAVENE